VKKVLVRLPRLAGPVGFLSELHALIDLYLHLQGFDTTTPAGKAMFRCLARSPSLNAR
jgi:hypothetical protein